MTDDHLSRIDDMLGEISGSGLVDLKSPSKEVLPDSKPGIHPLWALIDTWGGQIWLSANQLTLWRDEDE